VFSLFLGVSLSVTAFPVLARILTDRRVQSTPLGVIALTCAAVDDVSAWTLLAFVGQRCERAERDAAWTVFLTIVFLAVMFAWWCGRCWPLRGASRTRRRGRCRSRRWRWCSWGCCCRR
jgi:Kef-type K+ transport system membrane component KefB